jgi:glutaminyl-peptide cyclotransferase
MRRLFIISGVVLVLLAGIVFVFFWSRNPAQFQDTPFRSDVPIYSYRILKTYPHDRNAFTQGLVFEKGYLYEGTGLHGFSSLRKVDLQTGRVLKLHTLKPQFFGEGITVMGNRIIQLTYQSHVGFVYDKKSFALIKSFSYPTEGWGITNDGKWLITSEGTSKLHFLDPSTFGEIKTIIVHDHRGEIKGLNELEFVQGEIFANIWQENRLARIDPATGRITGWIELQGLLMPQDMVGDIDVLNGIAYDAEYHRLFVTGKLWPKLFEIELIQEK